MPPIRSTRPTRPTWTALPVDPNVDRLRHTADSAAGLVATLVAVLGTALLLGGLATGWGAGLVIVAAAVTALRALWLRSATVLTADLVLRFLAPVALAAAFAPPGREEDALAWTTAGAAVLLAGTEPLLGRVENRRRMWVSGLPGLRRAPAELLPQSAAGLAAVASTVVGAVVRASGGDALWWAVAVAASFAVLLLVAADRLRQIRHERRVRSGIARAVADYAPEFALYNARPDDSSYQIEMWLPYFNRVGRRFIVITRRELPARELAALPELAGVPVICCRTSRELEDLLGPSLTTVFYVNASSGNGQMVRHADLAHVHIGHGDSDKATSFNPTHAMYDRIFLAGEAAAARYAANGVSIPRSRLQVVGRPQVERIEAAHRAPTDVEHPTVLYAPTWRGDAAATELYSLPVAEAIVTGLLARGCRVIFRPHPYSHQNKEDEAIIRRVQALLVQDRERTGRDHLVGAAAERDRDVFGCFNDSDAMVCDVSSVAVDFLQSRKPMAMYVPPPPAGVDVDFAEQYPVARGCYLIEPGLTDLDEALDALLGADPLRAQRDEVRISYLGDFPPDSYADVFVEAVQRVVTEGVVHVDAVETLDVADTDDEDRDGETANDELSPTAAQEDGGDEPSPSPSSSDSARVAVSEARRSVTITVRRLADQLLDLISVLLAAAVAVLACSSADTWLVALLAVPVLAWVCWLRPPWRLLSARTTLGAFMPQRLLLAVAVTGLVARVEAPAGGLTAATFLVLAGVLGAECWIRPLRAAPRVQVANLPGISYTTWRIALHRDVYRTAMALLVLMLATAVLDVPNVAGVVVGAVVLLAALVLFGLDLVVVHAFDRAEEELAGAVAAYEPQFVVYFAAAPSAAYQLEMWMPYFERIGRRFLVVTRTAATFDVLSEMTRAPVVVRPTLRSLDATMAPTLTTAFYVNNGLKNTHFVERRQLNHVWLNHGDSEKPACFNPVHAIYDRLFVAGQAGIDRYARHGVDIPADKFEIVGRPQVESITVADAVRATPPTVLYAPTWVGPYADSTVYSLPVGVPVVQALLDRGCRVIFRAHPLNYRSLTGQQLVADVASLLAADAAASGRQHVWGPDAEVDMSLSDCFNASDAMIADVSAVVSDYLYSGKPFAVVAMGSTSERLVDEAPIAVASYVISESLVDLDAALQALLVDDPLLEQRRATRTYYLGRFDGADYAEGFLQAARRQIDHEPSGALESYAYAGE